MREADLLPYAVIAADIEGFTGHMPLRQTELRADFIDLFHRALADACVDLEPPGLRDRGDGGFALVPAGAPRAPLTAEVPRRLAMELGWRNASRDERHRLRIRLVLHHGPARPHRGDWVGPAVDTAARLLEANAGRKLLANTADADLVLLLSAEMYQDTVRLHEAGLDPADFVFGRLGADEKGAGTGFWASMVGRGQFRPAPAALAAAGMDDAITETEAPRAAAEPSGTARRSAPRPDTPTPGRVVHSNTGVIAMGDGPAIGGDVGSLHFGPR
jgi:hypothetical protein